MALYKGVNQMIKCNAVLTDLFGGDFNYCWVKRVEFYANEGASNASIVRKAKKELQISGLKSQHNYNGEMLLRYFNSDGIGLEITFEYED